MYRASQAFCGRGTNVVIDGVLVGEAKLVFFNKKGIALSANFVPDDPGQQKIMYADHASQPTIEITFPDHCPESASISSVLPITSWFVEISVNREVQLFAVFGEDPTAKGPSIRAFDKDPADDGPEVDIIRRERIFAIVANDFSDGDTYFDIYGVHNNELFEQCVRANKEAVAGALRLRADLIDGHSYHYTSEIEPVGVALPLGGGFTQVHVDDEGECGKITS